MQLRHLTYIITLLLSALGCAAAEPADSASVWFLTCAEGSDIYELEGHTALRIADPRTGTDCVVNWGLFDFSAPFFVYRFVKGETDYKSGVAPTELFLMQYAGSGREVTAQRLNLTAAETDTLITLISDCLRPENRTYRYNYVYDNCSTRALAYVERALGDSIALAAPQLPENTDTFRKLMAYYHRNYPWYQFGIDLALGSGIDHKLTRREYAFAPVVLRGMLSGATAGARKVVTSEEKSSTPQAAARCFRLHRGMPHRWHSRLSSWRCRRYSACATSAAGTSPDGSTRCFSALRLSAAALSHFWCSCRFTKPPRPTG